MKLLSDFQKKDQDIPGVLSFNDISVVVESAGETKHPTLKMSRNLHCL